MVDVIKAIKAEIPEAQAGFQVSLKRAQTLCHGASAWLHVRTGLIAKRKADLGHCSICILHHASQPSSGEVQAGERVY